MKHLFSFGNTILDLNTLHDLRQILKSASQSGQFTHRERHTAMELITEVDKMTEDLTATPFTCICGQQHTLGDGHLCKQR